MKLKCLILSVVISQSLVFAGEAEVSAVPFEPSMEMFYNKSNKYEQPEEIEKPKFYYPFEIRSGGINGEVVVLVCVGLDGYAEKLSVLSATQTAFVAPAIDGLKRARWKIKKSKMVTGRVCFYYRVIFPVDETG
jgi:hypothetical protein